MIRSAILLAAGRGQRQRPYTDGTPKPLLPVNGRPTLDFVLCAAARAGIKSVCIVTNYLEEQIFQFAGDGSRWNLAVTFAHQATLRGNGDALMALVSAWYSALFTFHPLVSRNLAVALRVVGHAQQFFAVLKSQLCRLYGYLFLVVAVFVAIPVDHGAFGQVDE